MSEPVFHLAAVAPPSEPGGDGPGARLRAAREKLGMTIEEICAELRLAPAQVNDLEHDRYDRIAAETYVRGYLRSYARVVKLPPEQVLEQFRTIRAFGESAHAVTPRTQSQMSFPGRPVRPLVTLLLVVGAGIAVGAWYAAGGGGVSPTTMDQAGTQPVSVAPLSAGTALTPGDPADNGEVAGDRPQTGTSLGPPSPALTGVHAGDGSVASSEPTTYGTGSEPADPELSTAQAPSPAPSDRVTLAFEQSSWAEVQDASGQRLLYQTVEAGRELELSGIAPFAVVLGNAAGVRVRFNGEPVSVAVDEAGTVSRFNLGEAETAAE